MSIIDIIKNWRRPKYETLNRLEILADKLLANLNFLQSLQPLSQLIPVLKANAYGHGLKEVASILNNSQVKLVAVDSFPEAQIVNRYFKGRALIIGEMSLESYQYLPWSKVEVVVYNSSTLHYLSRFGKKAKIHLFFNSGMNREGIKDLASFIKRHQTELQKVDFRGFCSHLAASEEEDSQLNQEQLQNFLDAYQLIRQAGFNPPIVHLGNSAAVFTLQQPVLTAFRPGLAFYGYSPFVDDNSTEASKLAINLQPALRIISKIISLQTLRSGETVSYNVTFQAKHNTKIAVIPFGYYEGLDRNLSNLNLNLLVNSTQESFWVPLVGRVCMNLSCLNLGKHQAMVGDEVLVLSDKPQDPNSLIKLSALANRIPYELLVNFKANIRRIIVKN